MPLHQLVLSFFSFLSFFNWWSSAVTRRSTTYDLVNTYDLVKVKWRHHAVKVVWFCTTNARMEVFRCDGRINDNLVDVTPTRSPYLYLRNDGEGKVTTIIICNSHQRMAVKRLPASLIIILLTATRLLCRASFGRGREEPHTIYLDMWLILDDQTTSMIQWHLINGKVKVLHCFNWL